MGPDCGTAVVGGVALGFANAVRPGSVGIVAASGTGAQQVMCLLDAAGVGVSHCLGVGGRDLSPRSAAAPRGRRSRRSPPTRPPTSVVVVSKPPAAEVLADLQAYAAGLGKPVHWATLGAGRPDLTAAVEAALRADGHTVPEWPAWTGRRQRAGDGRGAARALLRRDPRRRGDAHRRRDARRHPVQHPALGRSWRSAPTCATTATSSSTSATTRMTQGRAHPMIDPSLRLERIAAEAEDPTCGVLLLDLVLGYGAHPDPAAELADAIRAARATARPRRPRAAGRRLADRRRGRPAGPRPLRRPRCSRPAPRCFLSNAQATRHALSLLGPCCPASRRSSAQDDTDMTTSPLHGLLSARRLGGHRRRLALRRRPARPGSPGDRGRLAAADGRAPSRRPRRGPRRPPPRGGQRRGAAPDDRGRRRPRRRAAGPRGARARARHLPARRSADRPGTAPQARCRGRSSARCSSRGWPTPPRRRRPSSPSGDGITLEPCHHRDAVGPMAGVISPVDVGLRAARRGARRHVLVLPQRGARQGAALRRLRPRGHRPAALDELGARADAPAGRAHARPVRSTSRRSSPRCCRWATRATTATAPARSCCCASCCRR